MKEEPVTALPHHVLRGWQAFRIGDTEFFTGAGDGPERIGTGRIEYFDRVTQCGVCEKGIVWRVMPENVYCQDFDDCTWEFLAMMETPKLEIATMLIEQSRTDTASLSTPGSQADSEPLGLEDESVLKRCPFCGYSADQMRVGDAPLSFSDEGSIWHVGCSVGYGGCGAYVAGPSRQDAINRWNRRVPAAATMNCLNPHDDTEDLATVGQTCADMELKQ